MTRIPVPEAENDAPQTSAVRNAGRPTSPPPRHHADRRSAHPALADPAALIDVAGERAEIIATADEIIALVKPWGIGWNGGRIPHCLP